MRNERIFDLVVWLLIAAIGLASAYVCFGILNSEANATIKQYSVGGAIAGALISWSVLTSLYLQLRGSSNELQELRKRIGELQSKLIRGAPCPQGFDTEVDERQGIVLARPKDWEPKGGIVFQLELPDKKMDPTDSFAASFQCAFVPIGKDSNQTSEQCYDGQLQWYKGASDARVVQSYSHEVIRLGGEAGEVESLKVIAHYIARVVIKVSRETGRREREWQTISWPEFVGEIYNIYPAQLNVGQPIVILVSGNGFREGAVCYVNKIARATKVLDPLQAEVTLAAEDVASPGLLEVIMENPDTKQTKSNVGILPVIEAPYKRQVAEEAAPLGELSSAQIKANTSAERPSPEVAVNNPKTEEPTVVFQRIVSMRVICYHKALEKVYFFEFWDDEGDFLKSSDVFNQILASSRFLS